MRNLLTEKNITSKLPQKSIGKSGKGFTLVESLVAISILSLSILATFTAVQGSLQASINSKNQIAAFFLIQDAMEYVKNVRDNNALNSVTGITTNWLSGLSEVANDPCYFGKICYVDSYENEATNCVALPAEQVVSSCPSIRRNPGNDLLGYNPAWTDTTFRRGIQFTEVTPGEEVRVTVNISWVSRGVTKTFSVSETLFNRQ